MLYIFINNKRDFKVRPLNPSHLLQIIYIYVRIRNERILDINPNANVEIYQHFFMPDSKEILDN